MLTEDMKRLASEIAGLRGSRANLIAQLSQGNQQRRKAIPRLLAHMHKALNGAAVAARRERIKGLRDLRRGVAAARRGIKTDMAGAKKAWAGSAA
jgi:hypothetical protein